MKVNRSTYVAPLRIQAAKGCLNHPYHPSVVYIEGGFGGHKWWMAQTPFPPFEVMAPYVDRYELPCIHYSDDGLKWHPIEYNPIDDLTQKEIELQEYFSDPHLILRGDQLELYYRFSILENKSLVGNKTLLYRRTSKDGVHWSEREMVADLRNTKDVAIWGEQIISQAVLWKNGLYFCWYVDASHHISPRGVRVITSKDGVHWNSYQQCGFEGDDALQPWHIDVQYYQGKYQMMMFDVDANVLSWYQSDDAIHWTKKADLLTPSHKRGDFYENSLYRACSVWGNDRMRVYFSANNRLRSSIGLLESLEEVNFAIVNGRNSFFYTMQNNIQYRIYELSALLVKIKRRFKAILK